MFLFKPKTITIDCFTYNNAAFELFKIDQATKFYPEWWKTLPRLVVNTEKNNGDITAPTMKNCPGIIDYYKFGFIMPLWSDFLFEVGKINTNYMRVNSADPNSTSSKHPVFQRGEYLPENNYSHIKLESPWHIASNKNIKFLWCKPLWNFANPNEFVQPPSIIDFYHQHTSNVNFFFVRKQETYKFIMEAGTPMGHFVPLSENKIKIKHHLLTRIEFEQRAQKSYFRFSFNRSYIRYKNLKDKKRD